MNKQNAEYGLPEAVCEVCGGLAWWIDCPTGGWWRHRWHPADDHDAKAPLPAQIDGSDG